MPVLLTEFLISQPANQHASQHEAALMVSALARDLSNANALVVATRHATRDTSLIPDKACLIILEEPFTPTALKTLWTTYFAPSAPSDCCLLLAPESNNTLFHLTHHAESCAIPLLSSGAPAVQATTSKRQTTQTLQHNGIEAPPLITLDSIDAHDSNRYVLKPDDGVGSIDTFCLSGSALKHTHKRYPHHIITPWLEGRHLSLTLLCDGNGSAHVLSCNQHHITLAEDNAVHLRAIDVGIRRSSGQQAQDQQLAQRIAKIFPSLYGFVGIDIIDTNDTVSVIDINPRVTTSYVGLSTALNDNPATWLLDLHHTGQLRAAYPSPSTPTTVTL